MLLMRLGHPTVQIGTRAGTFRWQIDELTSQQVVLGTYEWYMQESFLTFLGPGSVVFDVGAHAGFHSLFCGLLVQPQGRVLAFEPHPDNRASLQRQILSNPHLPVTALPYALSDRCGLGLVKVRNSPYLSSRRK
jgi:hypothetical protein